MGGLDGGEQDWRGDGSDWAPLNDSTVCLVIMLHCPPEDCCFTYRIKADGRPQRKQCIEMWLVNINFFSPKSNCVTYRK